MWAAASVVLFEPFCLPSDGPFERQLRCIDNYALKGSLHLNLINYSLILLWRVASQIIYWPTKNELQYLDKIQILNKVAINYIKVAKK